MLAHFLQHNQCVDAVRGNGVQFQSTMTCQEASQETRPSFGAPPTASQKARPSTILPKRFVSLGSAFTFSSLISSTTQCSTAAPLPPSPHSKSLQYTFRSLDRLINLSFAAKPLTELHFLSHTCPMNVSNPTNRMCEDR